MAASLSRVSIDVRGARPEDTEFFARLSHRVFLAYDRSCVRSVVRMVKNPGSQTLVVTTGDRPVGFAVVRFETLARAYGPWLKPTVAHLDAIAVQPEFSGRGLGALLLRHAEASARRRGAVSISLLTAVDNRTAKRLFHGAGYHLMTSLDACYADQRRGLAMIKGLRRESAP